MFKYVMIALATCIGTYFFYTMVPWSQGVFAVSAPRYLLLGGAAFVGICFAVKK